MLLALSVSAMAGNPVTQIHTEGIEQGTVGLGFGWRWGDSPYVGIDDIGSEFSDNDYDLMPFYYYEGKYLFAHGSTAGVHLLDRNGFKLDAILDYRFDRLEPERSSFFSTVEAREQSLDGGVQLGWEQPWGELSLSWVTDTTDKHNGEEVDLTYRFTQTYDRWVLSSFVSYLHQDSDLVSYYYNVSAAESRDDLPEYSAGASQRWRAGINTSYAWSKRMRLFANFSYDWLGDEISDSPLVDESGLYSVMVGLAYGFGNTLDNSGSGRRDSARAGEWSWRINYGYTAEETFHKVHRGQLQRSDDVDTNLVGLTVGKLLVDGRRVDYWGKVSLNRRLERDEQEDFFELNAYVMAMGTGYSPWSNREMFRYGFGYGFSYADKVPAVEQIKQAKRGENTSHFLNYLEAQVDFPLRNLFGDGGWWRDCYAGLTLVHRSGIFGQVDILGNVSGGSDVVTGHLECAP